MNGFLIAGDKSGAGKTTITTGIISSFKRRGLSVAPFKCGPDYIDTLHLGFAANCFAHNLDSVMLEESALRKIFMTATKGKDIAIAEGVMGLFDGIRPENFFGSSYQVASMVNLPIILVLNTASTSYSIAAILKGFDSLCTDTTIAGVILNNIASDNHENLLREAITMYTDIPIVGCVRRQKDLILGSRHLGIKTALEVDDAYLTACADLVDMYIDMDFLQNLSTSNKYCNNSNENKDIATNTKSNKTCYIAYDKAFNFYYEANLIELRERGYQIKLFSPLNNETVEKADFVYIGGGYPEIYAKEISENTAFLNSIKIYVESGKPLLAECGGMMILTEGISTEEGYFPMAGFFSAKSEMTKKRQALGYINAAVKEEMIKSFRGIQYIGHEFHYSKLYDIKEPYLFTLKKLTTGTEKEDGFYKKRTLASYAHFHFASTPSILDVVLG